MSRASRPARSRAAPIGPSVADLEAMDRPALLALWATLVGTPPPRGLSRPFLHRVLAFELQARSQGGLPAAVRATLERQGAAAEGARASARRSASAKGDEGDGVGSGRGRKGAALGGRPTSPRLKPGGRLLREWNGVTHVVDVVEGGFLWRGQRHRSLSAIAQAITGAHWSGPRFFGFTGTAKVSAAGRSAAKPRASSTRRAA